MNLIMKRSVVVAGFVVLGCIADGALPQTYPARPVRVITPNLPGASSDAFTRIVASGMSEMLGQQFVVDNRGGAGGTIGAASGARAAPDGYTLVSGASGTMINSKFTFKALAYDTLNDFEPISLIVNVEGLLVVGNNVPARSVKEFVALAKARPGQLNLASSGIGSSSHLAGVLFTTMSGIDTVHVPYRSGGSAMALITGESHWSILLAAGVVGHINAGRIRALAITSMARSPLMPEMPTIDEAGVPGYVHTSWTAFFAPKGTPRPIIKTLHTTLRNVLAEPGVKRLFVAQGNMPFASESPEELGRFLRDDFGRVAKVMKIAGIKPE